MAVKIVTRHKGTIEWLKSKGIVGEVIEHLKPEDIKKGDKIYGNLSIDLMKEALDRGAEVYLLLLPQKIVKVKSVEIKEE